MKSLEQYKMTIMVVILIGGLLWAYQIYFGGSGTPVTSQTAQEIGADVLDLKQRLQSATFDQSIFSSPLFQALQDFSSPIPDQPRGRPNPFEVIGKD